MNNHSIVVPFSNAFLTALFSGMIATMVCFVFELWFREATFYGPSDLINVASIIFIVNLLLLMAGIVYYFLKTWFTNGDFLYILFFLLVIIFCIWKTSGIERFTDLKLNREFIQLLSGIIIITGIFVLFVPYFYNNRKINGFFYEADV
jgi:hypothetical protein